MHISEVARTNGDFFELDVGHGTPGVVPGVGEGQGAGAQMLTFLEGNAFFASATI